MEKVTRYLSSMDLNDIYTPEAAKPITPLRGSSQSVVLPSLTPANEGDAKFFVPTKDEQIVNMALFTFLDAITIHFSDIHVKWTPERKEFKCHDQRNQGYRARVDGYLCSTKNSTALAILEVKPCCRRDKLEEIYMQEGAQMAAWISSHPDPNYDKKLLSERMR